jgi:hypothetical protein
VGALYRLDILRHDKRGTCVQPAILLSAPPSRDHTAVSQLGGVPSARVDLNRIRVYHGVDFYLLVVTSINYQL